MNTKRLNSIGIDCLIILGLYALFFGFSINPIREFRLLKYGTTTQGVVTSIEGLDENLSKSMMLLHRYNYSFVTNEGKLVESSQSIFITLKDQPETAKPKFTASVTYLETNLYISEKLTM